MAAKKKVTLYLPEETLAALKAEADRSDRSLSWLLDTSWRIAGDHLRALPGVDETIDEAKATAREEV